VVWKYKWLFERFLLNNQFGYVQAGAGIVIDSRPDAEYDESLKKVEALLRAVEQSE
jgi:para-aminobenzoate synthetase component I